MVRQPTLPCPAPSLALWCSRKTCDIVRPGNIRPYVELAPLVPVSKRVFAEVQRARTPRFAYVPATAQDRLVADLDQVMTIEKSLLVWHAGPDRQDALRMSNGRSFARALARKRQRFAFPDEFSQGCQKLQERLKSKHNKNSPEGEHTAGLNRDTCRRFTKFGSCTNPTILSFWFIAENSEIVQPEAWARQINSWLSQIELSSNFKFSDP